MANDLAPSDSYSVNIEYYQEPLLNIEVSLGLFKKALSRCVSSEKNICSRLSMLLYLYSQALTEDIPQRDLDKIKEAIKDQVVKINHDDDREKWAIALAKIGFTDISIDIVKSIENPKKYRGKIQLIKGPNSIENNSLRI